jgi:two-component system, LytTR family, sensor histidine kinase AlgZ
MSTQQEIIANSANSVHKDGLGSRWFYSRLLLIPGATIFIALIFYSLGYLNLSRPAQHVLSIFIYSVCITLPCVAILPWVSMGCTVRFPRTALLIQGLSLILIAAGGSLIAAFVVCHIGINNPGRLWREYSGSLPFSIVITLTIGLAASAYETMRFKLQAAMLEARTRQMEEERANKLLAEARLSSLESSIHPHFLFNTLNSIAALIPSDPHRAEDLVGRLASLLRFSLNVQHSGLVPLSQELKVVRDYLEIEAARYGPRLHYSILAPDSLDSIRIPAMALQTLVENSIKHVAAVRPEGASIQITGRADADCAWLEVSDDGPGFSPSRIEAGHGLGNLVARLELLLGKGARLEVSREQDRSIVRLSLPLYRDSQ